MSHMFLNIWLQVQTFPCFGQITRLSFSSRKLSLTFRLTSELVTHPIKTSCRMSVIIITCFSPGSSKTKRDRRKTESAVIASACEAKIVSILFAHYPLVRRWTCCSVKKRIEGGLTSVFWGRFRKVTYWSLVSFFRIIMAQKIEFQI